MEEKDSPSSGNTPQCREANALGAGGEGGGPHECCEECKRTCKRNFWTEVLKTVVKVATAVMAAFGLASCIEED